MKLLAVAIPHHDANFAWWDGDTVRYLKVERTRQQKRFHFAALPEWKREAEAAFGIAAEDADDVVFSFDPAALPGALRAELGPGMLRRLATDASKAERLPEAVCRYLGVPRGWLVGHHYAHALSTWMLEEPAPADVQVVIDGVGDGRPWSVYRGDRLVAVGDIRNGSIGWGMREAGKLLGVQAAHFNDIAGKLMGLQAHGRIDAGYLERLERLDFGQLRELWSPEPWYAWRGDPLVGRLGLLDWAATVHHRMGALLLEFFRRHAAADEVVSYSGGVAQNVLWNSLLRAHFPRLVIPPHASDEGLSLGALEWLRRHHGQPPLAIPGFPFAQADTATSAPSERTIELAAQLLAQGRLVGWYQGHGEIGPRALGHRSLLLDARLPRGKERMNRVKRREPYRPFGASVLGECFGDWFEGQADPFMLHACKVKAGGFPAITHVDGSCRVQLVDRASDPAFHELLVRLRQMTGCPVLLNTSLNLAGRPIAGSPQDALALFEDPAIDAMVVGDTLHHRQAVGQPVTPPAAGSR